MKKIILKILISITLVSLISGCNNQTVNNQSVKLGQASPIAQTSPTSKETIDSQKESEGKMIQKDNKSQNNKPPEMQIDKTKSYQAVLSTSAGEIIIKLYADKTPITVNNFVYLSQKDFYNQTIFHRVIKDFMIQGGCPLGNGAGGPGYKFDDEPFKGEYKRGIVAMANAGPNTNGSQFFIMHQDYPLPSNYVIFGEVVKGVEVVDKIALAPVKPGGEGSTPVNPVAIESVKILNE